MGRDKEPFQSEVVFQAPRFSFRLPLSFDKQWKMNQRSISLRCFHRLGFTFLCGNAMMSTGNVLIFMRRIPPEHRLRCPFLLFFLVSVCPFLLIASLGFQDGRVWSPFLADFTGKGRVSEVFLRDQAFCLEVCSSLTVAMYWIPFWKT